MFYGGELLGETYQIIREIGKGGTGVVYLAWHTRLGKEVVVKRIYENFIGRMNVRAEVDILKGLHHTGLPQVYDFLQIGSDIYTVMEYIQGYDLQYYLDNGYQFSEKQLVIWLKQLCEVLDYLHNRNPKILHSDIKPGNVMITPEGNVCLIDFNISLDGQNNSGLKGISEKYAAPEQHYKAQLMLAKVDASHIELDERMDIYSLGATFYSLMTGMIPELSAQRQYPIEYLNIPYSDGFKRLIGKAINWEPKDRFSSAKAMLKVLGNTYTFDNKYKKTVAIRIASAVVSFALIATGIFSTIYGWNKMGAEAYEQAYNEFEAACNRYDNDEIIDSALNMLNENRYEKLLEMYPDDKAQLLNSVGDAYFEQEEYGMASAYYERTQVIKPDEDLYYCNQAIADARNSDYSKAESVLKRAKLLGTESDNILLAEQEIAYCKGDYEKVIEIGNAVDEVADKDIVSRIYMLSAKASMSLGDVSLQKDYLDKAYESNNSIRCLRELGKVCLELSEINRGQTYSLLQKSIDCYRTLWESPYAIESDGYNLALALEQLERYNDSIAIFKELEYNGSEMYQVYMHISYILLQTDGSLAEAKKYFNKAEQFYERQSIEDESFELIRGLLESRMAEGE